MSEAGDNANVPSIAPVRANSPWIEGDEEVLLTEIAGGASILEAAAAAGFAHTKAIYRRRATDPDFAARLDQAREAQQEHEMDACILMADAATAEDWQAVKMRIWARQWRAARIAPRRWGDKLDVTSAGHATQHAPVVFAAVFPEREGE